MPPVDPGALQRDRYERERMTVINGAMGRAAHIVSWSFIVTVIISDVTLSE